MEYTQRVTSMPIGRVNPKATSYKKEQNRASRLSNDIQLNNLIYQLRSAIKNRSINTIKNIILQNQDNINLLRNAIDSVMSEITNERGDTTLTSLVDNFDFFKAVYNAIKPFYSGVNLDSDRWKNNVLLVAVRMEKPDVVQFLLENGADPDSQNMLSGTTALMWAVIRDNPAIVQMLLNKEAIVDDQDTDGNTALGLAALEHNTEIVDLLMCKGADINHKNKDGYSIIQQAQVAMSPEPTEKQKKFVEYLQNIALDKNQSFLASCQRASAYLTDYLSSLPSLPFKASEDTSVTKKRTRDYMSYDKKTEGGKKRKTKRRKSNKNKKSKKSKKSKRRRN